MQRPVLNDKYALEREIGDGATAKVFSGIAIADGTTVAIKFIKPEFLGRQDAINSIRSEVFMLKNL
jgi:serine/threonine protein kinase